MLFGIAALCNAAMAAYVFARVPEFRLRFAAWWRAKPWRRRERPRREGR
jgi:hypothetical protein